MKLGYNSQFHPQINQGLRWHYDMILSFTMYNDITTVIMTPLLFFNSVFEYSEGETAKLHRTVILSFTARGSVALSCISLTVNPRSAAASWVALLSILYLVILNPTAADSVALLYVNIIIYHIDSPFFFSPSIFCQHPQIKTRKSRLNLNGPVSLSSWYTQLDKASNYRV